MSVVKSQLQSGHGQDFIDLASPKRTLHILLGEGPSQGGHLWPGASGKTPFPATWSPDKIIQHVSDIATDPKISWTQKTGAAGAQFTKCGDPHY